MYSNSSSDEVNNSTICQILEHPHWTHILSAWYDSEKQQRSPKQWMNDKGVIAWPPLLYEYEWGQSQDEEKDPKQVENLFGGSIIHELKQESVTSSFTDDIEIDNEIIPDIHDNSNKNSLVDVEHNYDGFDISKEYGSSSESECMENKNEEKIGKETSNDDNHKKKDGKAVKERKKEEKETNNNDNNKTKKEKKKDKEEKMDDDDKEEKMDDDDKENKKEQEKKHEKNWKKKK